MSALILDTGALVAVDRGDRGTAAKLRVAEQNGIALRSTGVVIAEAWRDEGGRQANLARFLKSVDIQPIDERLGRQAGVLLGKAGLTSPADATVVAIATTGDRVLTSDPRDISRLVDVSGRSIRVITC